MARSLLISGGHLVDPASGVDAPRDIRIEGNKVAQVAPAGSLSPKGERVDATGCHIFPGLIDTHAHLREPGFEHKETIAAAGQMAVAGGITTLFAMPNTQPVCDNAAVCALIAERARAAGRARVMPVGAMTRNMEGKILADMGELRDMGCPAVSDAWVPIQSGQTMRRAMEYAKGVGLAVITVPQDRDLSLDGVMHEGALATRLGLSGIPAAAEEIAVARSIALVELTGCPTHISVLSTAGSVRMVRDAIARGVPITAGTTPHYLHLTDARVAGYDTSAKVYPPLRPAAHVAALRQAVADGTLSVIASCHAPHADYEKATEFNHAPFGISGLSTALSLTLKLVEEGVLDLSSAIARWTVGPREAFGLAATGLGSLAEGAPADLAVVRLGGAWKVLPEHLGGRQLASPFLGETLPGVVCLTLVAGQPVFSSLPLSQGSAS